MTTENHDPSGGKLAELYQLTQRLQTAADAATAHLASLRSDTAKLRNLAIQIANALPQPTNTETAQ